MNNRTTVELYRQTLRERLQIAEKTRSPSITLMTSEVQVLHEILKDHIKLMKKSENETEKSRQVIYEGDGYADGQMVYDFAYCPTCNHETEIDSENWGSFYCPECGQKLEWKTEVEK